MKMPFTAIKRKIPIKYFMVAYLGLLTIFSAWYGNLPTHLAAGAAIVALYSLFDLIWTRLRDRVWYLPVSSWISGLVLSVVALTSPSVLQVVALPFLAVLSKRLFHFGKTRHVFNPAAFGMTALNLFVPAVSWWAVSWGMIPTVIVAAVGLFILWRQERWHVAFSFLGAFALLSLLFAVLAGNTVAAALAALRPFLLSGPLIFFATVMLIEPITSGFSTRRQRVTYGLLVGSFAAIVSAVLRFLPQLNLDSLLAGLLLGDLLACVLFLPSPKTPPLPAK